MTLAEVEQKAVLSRPSGFDAKPGSYDQIPKKFNWAIFLFVVFIHVGAFAGFFVFTWKALILCIVLHWVTACLGITIGYHRLLTHRSFKTSKFLEYFFTLCAAFACQAGPITWVAGHRLHHLKSDQPEDPHTPLRSFFWAHMGWIFYDYEAIHSDAGKARLAPDLVHDKGHIFFQKTHIFWTVLLSAALYAWGGWPFVIWGIFVRTVFAYHSTWLVNSAAHRWGYQSYKTKDQSRNLWWVAAFSYGEGWHNNHHAFQYSARHGLKWWEIDITYWIIKMFARLGLATELKLPPK